MAVVTDQFVKIKETEEFTGIWQNTKRYDYAWEKKPTDRKKIKTSESWLVRFRIFIERGHRVDIRPQEQEQQMTVDAWKKKKKHSARLLLGNHPWSITQKYKSKKS